MTRTGRWITSLGAVVLGLALLAFVGAWRLGLPVLLSPLASIGTPLTDILNSGPAPGTGFSGSTEQPQQSSKTGTQADQSPSTLGSVAIPTWNSTQLTKDQLRQQIDDYYTARLQNLAASYESRLNGLVSEAFNEYQSDKNQGKDVSVVAMAFKYMSEGNALEKQCDAQFYPLLDEFEADLRKNNLPLDAAIKAKQEYESAKVNRKKELLSAAAKMI